MSAVQQGTLLEVLKKKMRAMKDELETAKEQAEDAQSRVMDEVRRREEVSLQISPPVNFPEKVDGTSGYFAVTDKMLRGEPTKTSRSACVTFFVLSSPHKDSTGGLHCKILSSRCLYLGIP